MKKTMTLLLALVMALSLCACARYADVSVLAKRKTPADEIPDTATSATGKYEIAFVTDVGQLKDRSFNQGIYDGVKLFASAKGKTYKYYRPPNGEKSTDEDRYDAMRAAVNGGAKLIVTAGFGNFSAMKRAAQENPQISFLFVDGDNPNLDNVACVCFREEESGFLAGYAVVKEGYERLGYIGGGGGTTPSCVRFAWGYVQGANQAAMEMGKKVSMNISWQYGDSYQPSPELQTMISGWYISGTQVVFSCGGNILQSVAAAASSNDAAVIGVDCDQSGESDTIITSAMKKLPDAVQWGLQKFYDGEFGEIAGVTTSLGIAEEKVCLPEDTWSLTDFTLEDYRTVYRRLQSGEIKVDGTRLDPDYSTVKLSNLDIVMI